MRVGQGAESPDSSVERLRGTGSGGGAWARSIREVRDQPTLSDRCSNGLVGRLFLPCFSSNFARFFFFSFFLGHSGSILLSSSLTGACSVQDSTSRLSFKIDVDVLISDRLFSSFFA